VEREKASDGVNKDLENSRTSPRSFEDKDRLERGRPNSVTRLPPPHHHHHKIPRTDSNKFLKSAQPPLFRPENAHYPLPKMCGDLTIYYEECDHFHHQPEKFTCIFSDCGFHHLPSGSKLLPTALHTEKGKCPDCLAGKLVAPTTPPKKPASRKAFRGRGKSG
jgi:hypothetical protein